MTLRLTRRTFLYSASAATAAANQKAQVSKPLPQVEEFLRFPDGMTEAPVTRLTSLSSANLLPDHTHRSVSTKGRFLVFSSDRGGSYSPYRLDLRNGQVNQLLSTAALDPASLSLDPAERILLFLDGHTLKQLSLSSKRVQVIGDNISYYSLGESASEVLFVRDGGLYGGAGGRLLARDVDWCEWRPGGAGCLFSTQGAELWYLALQAGKGPVRLAEGGTSEPCWSPDGRSAFFLRNQSVYEVIPEAPQEKQVGGSSHFAAFSPNRDSSVFVCATRSKAQPTINLLLRNPPREFTLCEHKASHPANCQPIFSADSRRVYFNTDFQGKPAIYAVNVESLIEATPEG